MTDAADFLATIRAAPQEAGPAGAYCDWLEERGQRTPERLHGLILECPHIVGLRLQYARLLEERGDPLGEFIRVQCELAGMWKPNENLPGCESAMQRPNGCFPDEACHACSLRARESALLSATTAEPCPRIVLGGDSDWFCVSEDGKQHYCHLLERGGPDYFEADSALFSPVGSRVDVQIRKKKNDRWKTEVIHGLLVRKVNRGEAEEGHDANINTFTLKRDELSVPGDGVVQVSNAIRWAGPLGNRPMSALLGNINAGGDRHVGHVSWNGADTEGGTIYGRFRLGLLSEISLSCAALVGERCNEVLCGAGDAEFTKSCPKCHGSGRVNSLAADLVKFPLLPDSGVVLSDKKPEEHTPPSGIKNWSWYRMGFGDDPATLPGELFDALAGDFLPGITGERKAYPSPAAALRALSRAACGWIREQAKELVT